MASQEPYTSVPLTYNELDLLLASLSYLITGAMGAVLYGDHPVDKVTRFNTTIARLQTLFTDAQRKVEP